MLRRVSHAFLLRPSAAVHAFPLRRASSSSSSSSYPPAVITAMLARATSLDDLFALRAMHADSMEEINTSAFWTTLGRLTQRAPRRAASLQQHNDALASARLATLRALPSFGPRQLVNTAHGAARAKVGSLPPWDVWWDEIARCSLPMLERLSWQHITSLLWAFTRSNAYRPALFHAVAREVESREVERLSVELIAQIAWCFSSVGHSAPRLMLRLADAAAPHISQISTAALSALCFTMARARVDSPRLHAALVEELPSRLPECGGREVSSIFTACMAMESMAPQLKLKLLDGFAKSSEGRLEGFDARSVAAMIHVISAVPNELEHPPSVTALLDGLIDASSKRVDALRPADLQSVARSLALMTSGGRVDAQPEIFHVLARHAAGKLGAFSDVHLWNLAWAFARAGVRSPVLFTPLAQEALSRLDSISPSGLVALAWSFARLDVDAPHFASALYEATLQRHHEFDERQTSALHLAFVKLKVVSPTDEEPSTK
ncbi:hypothetical protein AB1Y20_005526 [Prymnesium parvum]|uniref:RNA-editing substrate-binding complex 6 protein domain-containing protein n=1 Tax=Prymnesium parvum TaxID=97485 RepID=A0AB34J6P7_PRYPA